MRLGGKVDNDIRLRHKRIHDFAVSYIAVPETNTTIMIIFIQIYRKIVNMPGVCKSVKDYNFIIRVFFIDMPDKIASYKTRATCNLILSFSFYLTAFISFYLIILQVSSP